MTDTPKPDLLEKLGVQALPDKKLCDKYGNLLVYEKNRKIWSIVSFQHYMEYAACYEKWAYLPEEPANEPRTEHYASDIEFVDRCCKMFMAGVYNGRVILNKHLAKFTPDAKRKLLDEYSATDNSLNAEYVLSVFHRFL